MNSTFGHRNDTDAKTATLIIHPTDAAHRCVRQGDLVRVFNDRGECWLAAKITEDVKPGVVCALSMRWSKRSPGQRGINQLTSERLTDLGGGPTFYSCLVQVEPGTAPR